MTDVTAAATVSLTGYRTSARLAWALPVAGILLSGVLRGSVGGFIADLIVMALVLSGIFFGVYALTGAKQARASGAKRVVVPAVVGLVVNAVLVLIFASNFAAKRIEAGFAAATSGSIRACENGIRNSNAAGLTLQPRELESFCGCITKKTMPLECKSVSLLWTSASIVACGQRLTERFATPEGALDLVHWQDECISLTIPDRRMDLVAAKVTVTIEAQLEPLAASPDTAGIVAPPEKKKAYLRCVLEGAFAQCAPTTFADVSRCNDAEPTNTNTARLLAKCAPKLR